MVCQGREARGGMEGSGEKREGIWGGNPQKEHRGVSGSLHACI